MSDLDNKKSTSRYVFVYNDGTISWKCSKQSIIADLTPEAKYVVTLNATKEGFWLKKFVAKLDVMTSDAIPLNCDNNGA